MAHSVRHLLLVQVMISGSWDRASQSREFASPSAAPPVCVLSVFVSLSQIKYFLKSPEGIPFTHS